MDLSTNQELMGMQNSFRTMYGSHVFKMKENFDETDIKGNNNMFNSLKTETNSNHCHDNSSLFQVNCTNENQLEVDNSLFSYSSFKKAMDLRTHNRTLDGTKRTIFDDAEYFAKNYCYKLLPITFEQLDETIIQSEHNYSLSSLNSESDPEEDCSRTMDYSQIKEKNYKKRRTKFREEEMLESGTSGGQRKSEVESSPMVFDENDEATPELEERKASVSPETVPVQPLDLSASHLVQEEKTDSHLRERPNSIVGNDEVAQPDSDKENVNSELNGIRVTITRPDEKENYQPCDLFLNDIARLVPWLIDKDCFEVDIQDRTCDDHDELRTHRLYYVISESTWRLFQRSNDRVILTNDQSLGQPLRKANKDERPSFLIFDQFSLAKCLADYCQEIGGCFEYTCVEEQKKEEVPEEEKVKEVPDEVEEVKKTDEVEEVKKTDEVVNKAEEEKKENVDEIRKEQMEGNEEKEKKKIKELETDSNSKVEGMQNEDKASKVSSKNEKQLEKKEENLEKNIFKKRGKEKQKSIAEVKEKQAKSEATAVKSRNLKRKKQSSIQQEPKKCRITTRSKSTSGSETSQKSDKPVIKKGRKKRETATLPKEPPKKRPKPADPEDLRKKTRSGKVLEEVKISKPTEKEKRNQMKRVEGKGKVAKGKAGKRLRSHEVAQRRGEVKERVKLVKTRGRKR